LENERSITITAGKLFLHRNSLRYRLERIEEITGADLDNPGERAYIYFSYLIKNSRK
jgi:purine catabolism regulator